MNPDISSFASSQASAIALVQEKLPELKDYPSDQLPPKSIKTEQTENGVYVAFVQEGSGRAFISARCFLVDSEKNITVSGTYSPKPEEGYSGVFSAKICAPVPRTTQIDSTPSDTAPAVEK